MLSQIQLQGTKMPEQSTTLADDPFRGRKPTSHERMTGLPWDASYSDGPAPWDIGRPQPVIVRLVSKGVFAGSVLDTGCGTGENTLHIASLGLPVLGVDVAETALAIARKKGAERRIEVEFAAADALHLERLARRFETVLDCGLFHTFESDEQPERGESGVCNETRWNPVCVVLQRRRSRSRAASRPSGRAESGLRPGQWMECNRDRIRAH
jgi:SAM-dependent methyltransferase